MFLKKVAGSKSELVFGAIPYQNGVIPNIYPDVQKLASTIGIRKRYSFEEGISATIDSIKKTASC